jgi:hypothetical protein
MTKKKSFKILVSILIASALLFSAFFIYTEDYYRADYKGVGVFATASDVTVKAIDENTMIFSVPDAKAGFIFYPGGKVEHSAYIALAEACAQRGILFVIVEMPFDLAVFNVNGADGIREKFDRIESWYIGGHSLGGSMSCSYVAKNDGFDGVILLGSYSTEDIRSLRVLSIYGSCDGVLNREKYEENKSNLPSDFEELVIDGGNHAYFGVYGEQKGDGKATVTNKEQIEITATKIAEFTR